MNVNDKLTGIVELFKNERHRLINISEFFNDYEEPNTENLKDGDYIESYHIDTVNYFLGMHGINLQESRDDFLIKDIIEKHNEEVEIYGMDIILSDNPYSKKLSLSGKFDDDSSIKWFKFLIE